MHTNDFSDLMKILVPEIGIEAAHFLFTELMACAPGTPERVEVVKIIANYLGAE